MIIQLAYIVSLLQENKWVHHDVHFNNVMYKQMDVDTLSIYGQTVPTYGYVYSLIDYGLLQPLSEYNKEVDMERIYWNLRYYKAYLDTRMIIKPKHELFSREEYSVMRMHFDEPRTLIAYFTQKLLDINNVQKKSTIKEPTNNVPVESLKEISVTLSADDNNIDNENN